MSGARKAVSSASAERFSFRTWGTHVHTPRRSGIPRDRSFAVVFFGLGNYLAARQNATSEQRMAAMRAEIDLLRQRDAPGDRRHRRPREMRRRSR